jgi:hypothetical protein
MRLDMRDLLCSYAKPEWAEKFFNSWKIGAL